MSPLSMQSTNTFFFSQYGGKEVLQNAIPAVLRMKQNRKVHLRQHPQNSATKLIFTVWSDFHICKHAYSYPPKGNITESKFKYGRQPLFLLA